MTTITLFPGVTLRCFSDRRFKQGALSLQFVRPMCREEAALNALLPAVLLRGSRLHPDIRSITNRLDDLYGASVGTLVRRIGDYQTTGFYCGFMEDRYAMAGDAILEPMAAFVEELLLDPAMENGVFRRDFVEGEQKNLLAAIDAERNDKRIYANQQMLRLMCKADSFGIPRLGDRASVAAITPASLYAHYRKVLAQSRVELFYVGAAEPETVAAAVRPLFAEIERHPAILPGQTGFHDAGPAERVETMEVAQGKLAMGFVTPITLREEGFAAMQVLNLVFGAGMISKLYVHVREKLSLCYDITSGYHSAKGIVTVSAGIDPANEERTRQEIMTQLAACQTGEISDEELTAAKQAIRSSLQSTHDSPGAIENYYGTSAISGLTLSPEEYLAAVEAVTREDVARAAQTVQLHTVYFLKGGC